MENQFDYNRMKEMKLNNIKMNNNNDPYDNNNNNNQNNLKYKFFIFEKKFFKKEINIKYLSNKEKII